MSCGVGCRCGSDLVLLWLWCRLAAVAPVGPLAWEPPYATGMALKKPEKKIPKGLLPLSHSGIALPPIIASLWNSWLGLVVVVPKAENSAALSLHH